MPKLKNSPQKPSAILQHSQDNVKKPVLSKQKFMAITEKFIEAKSTWALWNETNSDKINQSNHFTETAEAARDKSMQLLKERDSLDEAISKIYHKIQSTGFSQIDLEQPLLNKYILSLQINRYQWIEAMCCSFDRILHIEYQNEFKRYREAKASFAEAMHHLSSLIETEWKNIHNGAFEKEEFLDVLTNLFNENLENFTMKLSQCFNCSNEYEVNYQEVINKIQFLIERPEWLPPETAQQSALLTRFKKIIEETKPDSSAYQSLCNFAKLQILNTGHLPVEMKSFLQFIIKKDLISLSYLQKKVRLNSQFSQQISTVDLYQQVNVLLITSTPSIQSSQKHINELGKHLAKATADKQHQVDTIIELEPFLLQIEYIDSELKSEKEKLKLERLALIKSKNNIQPTTLLFLMANRVLQDKIYRLKTKRKRIVKQHQPHIHQAIAALALADISEQIYHSSLKKYAPDVESSGNNIAASITSAAVIYNGSVKYETPLMTLLQQHLNTSEQAELTYDEFLKRIISILDNPYWIEEYAEQGASVFIRQLKEALFRYDNQNKEQQFIALKNKAAQFYEAEQNPKIFRQNVPEHIRLLLKGIIHQDLNALNLLINKMDFPVQINTTTTCSPLFF